MIGSSSGRPQRKRTFFGRDKEDNLSALFLVVCAKNKDAARGVAGDEERTDSEPNPVAKVNASKNIVTAHKNSMSVLGNWPL